MSERKSAGLILRPLPPSSLHSVYRARAAQAPARPVSPLPGLLVLVTARPRPRGLPSMGDPVEAALTPPVARQEAEEPDPDSLHYTQLRSEDLVSPYLDF
ncbi:hypothetical protein AAES_80495 [Amazona aestiva]|uniref:Uncharacterized protein n=1 Tax=Amazona aestiva TaxID=12930 RepID=A0A0Q3Q0I6_AMAAE|nr:hypothetical protein AAES_80495 [Amazona aestiva]